MQKELEDQLLARYPYLYSDDTESCMDEGFCVGDGWFALIVTLSAELERYGRETGLQITTAQVKEKFGMLAYYVRGGDAYVGGMILAAEALSARLCQVCGAPGALQTSGSRGSWCKQHGGKRWQPAPPRLPSVALPSVHNPAWEHLFDALAFAVASRDPGPAVTIDAVHEEDGLGIDWHGGDAMTGGMIRLIETFAARKEV